MYQHVAGIIEWKYNAMCFRDFIVNETHGQTTNTYWNLPAPQPTIAEVLTFEADYLAAVAQDQPLRRAEAAMKSPTRLLAALTLRLSSSWASMTTAEKNRVNAVIDNMGAKILTALRG